jgi:hypothetical protein
MFLQMAVQGVSQCLMLPLEEALQLVPKLLMLEALGFQLELLCTGLEMKVA